jgi:hypothetical protein
MYLRWDTIYGERCALHVTMYKRDYRTRTNSQCKFASIELLELFLFLKNLQMRTKSYLTLAQTLRKGSAKPHLPVIEYGPNPTKIPPTFDALSEIVHIPTRFEKYFSEEKQTRKVESKTIKEPNVESLRIKRLQSKPVRHAPIPQIDNFDLASIGSGKRISKTENILLEVLESRQLAKVLQIDKWIITRLTLSSNGNICNVWWKIDTSATGNDLETEIVSKS